MSTAKIKETEYFSINFERGIDWYEQKFDLSSRGAPDGPVFGEFSNNYYLDPRVPARLIEANPDVRIIVMLRSASTLAVSMAQFARRRGIEGSDESLFDLPIGKVLGSGYQRRESAGALQPSDTPKVVEAARLTNFIEPWLEHFSPSNFYVCEFERMKADPQEEFTRILRFLGVDPSFEIEGAGQKVNASLQPRQQGLARLATQAAGLLRMINADRLLTRLHGSTAIKRLLFRESAIAKPELAPAIVSELDDEHRKLRERLVAGGYLQS